MTATPRPRTTTPRSQLYRLIDQRLDGGLVDYVCVQRAAMKSWRWMATDLHQKTGIEVSYKTLRAWFADRIQVEVKVA
jgi:hypothetical protein